MDLQKLDGRIHLELEYNQVSGTEREKKHEGVCNKGMVVMNNEGQERLTGRERVKEPVEMQGAHQQASREDTNSRSQESGHAI